MILDALHKITNHGASLTRDEARDVMAEILRGESTDAQIGALLVALHMKGALDVPTAAMCKLWLTETYGRVVDTCLQLHGGYGYMWEYPIARAYADARVQRIFGGASEIMKEIIGRTL